VSHEYNRQAQRIQTTDQAGTVHQFSYDLLGRQTLDCVAQLGEGLDAAVAYSGCKPVFCAAARSARIVA
jgi:hypothetical protein